MSEDQTPIEIPNPPMPSPVEEEIEPEQKKKSFEIELPNLWTGPLDLLLDLIRTQEVDIHDIPISEITHQYLEAIKYMQKLDIDIASDFLVMAATLIYIKSKMLLPAELEDDEELFLDPRKNLVEQLLEYQKFKNVAEVLGQLSDYSERLVERRDHQLTFSLNEEDDDLWEEVTLFELLKVFSGIVHEVPAIDFLPTDAREFTVEGKIDQITEALEREGSVNFFELFSNEKVKSEILAAFLAVLELYKMGRIRIKQHKVFGDIHLFKREPSVGDTHLDIEEGYEVKVEENNLTSTEGSQ